MLCMELEPPKQPRLLFFGDNVLPPDSSERLCRLLPALLKSFNVCGSSESAAKPPQTAGLGDLLRKEIPVARVEEYAVDLIGDDYDTMLVNSGTSFYMNSAVPYAFAESWDQYVAHLPHMAAAAFRSDGTSLFSCVKCDQDLQRAVLLVRPLADFLVFSFLQGNVRQPQPYSC